MRMLRWRWWCLVAGARLRRLGGRLVVEAAGTPRLLGPLRLEPGPRPVLADPVLLERNVFCATNVVVLRGTTILRNAVVAAGAVVAGGEHAGGWLIGGIPARALKPLTTTQRDDPPVPLR